MRIGSLFSGYGGLDLGVRAVLGGEVAWHVEVDPSPAAILAHHWPGVPNLGDVTAVDWSAIAPVDVLTGGFPCQDVSAAGRRAGLAAGTRSGLWSHMAAAVAVLRPSLVIVENVRGLLSAPAEHPAHRDLEPCPWCLGDDDPRPLRALGAVLGDLADLGYDARWCGLRAADVGAPHGRFRVFLTAWPAADPGRLLEHQGQRGGSGTACGAGTDHHPRGRDHDATTDAPGDGRDQRRPEPAGLLRGPDAAGRGCVAGDAGRGRHRPGEGMGATGPAPGTPADPDSDSLRLQPVVLAGRRRPALAGHAGADAAADADRDGREGLEGAPGGRHRLRLHERDDADRCGLVDWGPYGLAVRRWERRLGRPAPAPTEPGPRTGRPRLSPRFVEWLMGLDAGHVTAVPGLSRNDQLRALGNGVVPQQAAEALRRLLEPGDAA